MNCLIRPCCAKIEDGDESKMIQTVIEHIHKLIQLTGAKFVYIAIDGPAPKAKMIQQQRSRRHKSVLENKPWDTKCNYTGNNLYESIKSNINKGI